MTYTESRKTVLSSQDSSSRAQGFGSRLKQERTRTGLTQAEFAKVAGVSRASQANYEQELRVPDLQYLAAIFERVDVDYIIAGDGAISRDMRGVNVESIRPILLFLDSLEDEGGRDFSVDARAKLWAFFLQQIITAGKIDVALMHRTVQLL